MYDLFLKEIKKRRDETLEKFCSELEKQMDLTQEEKEFLKLIFANPYHGLQYKFKAQYRSVVEKGYIRVVWNEEDEWLDATRIESFPKYQKHNLFELEKERKHKEATGTREGEKKEYTKEELEEQLDPVACKLDKELCPKGQDIVQVVLPWLDDANDCIEVYLIRKENGEIVLAFD